MTTVQLEFMSSDDDDATPEDCKIWHKKVEMSEALPLAGQGLWFNSDIHYFNVYVAGWVLPRRGAPYYRVHLGKFPTEKEELFKALGFKIRGS